MTRTEKTANTCVIIMEVKVDRETTVLGVIADPVQEVLDREPGRIAPAPRIVTTVNTEFIRGMGKRDERFIIILDIDKVFPVDALSLVQAAEGEMPAGIL